MDDKYEAQLAKRQIKKAMKGKLKLPSGNHIVEASPGGILNILEDQLRDLEIQKSYIIKEMEENQNVVL